MEYRNLGKSGLKVPLLSFGAGTFGGSGPLFSHWGTTDVEEARRLVDICLDAGVTLVDTADVYSDWRSRAGARPCWSPPRRACPPAMGRTTGARRAIA